MAFIAVASLSLLACAIPQTAVADAGAWQATAAEVETALIGELASLVRGGGTHRLEPALAPIYEALPKNAQGRLEPEQAGAALRRAFLQRPGWTLKASTSEQLLKLVADRTRGRGVGLRELAAVAASLEGLAREESAARLRRSYRAAGLPAAGRSGRARVAGALRLYAEAYLGGNASGAAAGAWLQRLEAKQWRLAGAAGQDGTMSFQEAGRAASAIERELSVFKGQECLKLQPTAVGSYCLEVSSLYSLCCRSSEELGSVSAAEPGSVSAAEPSSLLTAALTDFPRLWLFTFACFLLTVLLNLGRLLLAYLLPIETAEGDAAKTEGEAAKAEGDAIEAEEAPGAGKALLGSCVSLVLLGGAAVALDLLDVRVIAPALAVGLVVVAAARFAPKQPAKVKKV